MHATRHLLNIRSFPSSHLLPFLPFFLIGVLHRPASARLPPLSSECSAPTAPGEEEWRHSSLLNRQRGDREHAGESECVVCSGRGLAVLAFFFPRLFCSSAERCFPLTGWTLLCALCLQPFPPDNSKRCSNLLHRYHSTTTSKHTHTPFLFACRAAVRSSSPPTLQRPP